jgi:hypothetical protein
MLRYEMEGEALADFAYNRIGFCVLHPDDGMAGKPFALAKLTIGTGGGSE